jgi:hypothetical protein
MSALLQLQAEARQGKGSKEVCSPITSPESEDLMEIPLNVGEASAGPVPALRETCNASVLVCEHFGVHMPSRWPCRPCGVECMCVLHMHVLQLCVAM